MLLAICWLIWEKNFDFMEDEKCLDHIIGETGQKKVTLLVKKMYGLNKVKNKVSK